ncbi:MAG: putative toxin-antitoxin system toxin component, PIN family [Bacteroidales bacterium]|nr:putative toxin-antitoxin system toxin component, PIN family [Bacteroidales bacterium]MBR5081591.1 putative toxin-antitoxin system toxin component, PIN family [Bacteroidales bacterium]
MGVVSHREKLLALQSFFERTDIEICYCAELEREFLDVSHREKIVKYVDEKQIQRVHKLMTKHCHCYELKECNKPLVRDPQDAFLLALSDAVCADYLITGDADLKDTRKHNHTSIIDFETALGIL